MSSYLYFDSAATAIPCEQALAAVALAYTEYGNPSSVHKAGMAAKRLVDRAREQVARALHCTEGELIFTASGTEASNQAIFGLAKMRGKRARRILTTDSEHPSVEEPMKALEAQGFEVIRLSTKGGVLHIDELQSALSQPVAFVSIMQANNETGALYDIAAVRRALDTAGSDAPLHCDAVQGFLKTEDRRLSALCDLITVSAHKIGGVKGAGALYVRKDLHGLPAYLLGGGQERGLRSGTENVAAIAAFGAAAEACRADRTRLQSIAERKAQVLSELSESGIRFHLPPDALPNILHLSVPGVPSSWSVNFLSERSICVSAGSACSAQGRKKGNRVLSAYGLPAAEIESSLRISFSEYNTKEECTQLCEALRLCAKLKR